MTDIQVVCTVRTPHNTHIKHEREVVDAKLLQQEEQNMRYASLNHKIAEAKQKDS